MRLTADLILRSPAFINPVKDRELDLRGNKIPFIENLGVTQDQYDAIDFSDNEICKLENFPLLKRLKTIFMSNNRVSKIADSLHTAIPNLETLVLINNRISRLEELEALRSCKNLRSLALLDNPVTKIATYRLYVIHCIPSLRLLDFRRVRIKERRAARQLYADEEGKEKKTRTFNPGEIDTEATEKLEKIKSAISNVKSVEEAMQLEQALSTGEEVPSNK